MAKNLNSISFIVLLLVLVMASTEFFKSEASHGVECPPGSGCLDPARRKFLGQCGPVPFPGTDSDCCMCCKNIYPSPPLCWAVVEGSEPFCHCYGRD